MQNRLFVGNLPYDVTEDQLRDLFAQAGAVVSVKLITDKYSGRSKGFGFIEMETAKAAEEAMKMLDGKDFGGRPLAVKEARPPREEGAEAPAPSEAPAEPEPVEAEEAPVEETPAEEPAEEVEEEEEKPKEE